MKNLSNILGPTCAGNESACVALLLAECKSARDRGDRVRHIMRVTGWSRNKVYDLAKKAGWASGRKARADKGDTVLSEAQKLKLAGMTVHSFTQRHKAAPAEVVLDVANQSGIVADEEMVSPATLNRYLRDMKISKRMIRRSREKPPTARIRSEHPNQEWQFDITPATKFYLDDSKGLVDREDTAILYWGNMDVIDDISKKKKLLRFVMIDHYSGAFYVRYYVAAGESAIDVFDFLVRSMAPKQDTERYPMRGVPVQLMADKGSGLNAFLCLNFLDTLGVMATTHAAHNPNRKGAVEAHMWHWEQYFETRFKFEDIRNLEQLNGLAEMYCLRYNATKVHSRHGHTRSAMWSTIKTEHLVNLPADDVCREIAQLKPEERTVKQDRTVPFLNQAFFVSDPDLIGQRVIVRRNPYNLDEVTVEHEGRRISCPRLEQDEAGFIINSIAAVSGSDDIQPEHSHAANTATLNLTDTLPKPEGLRAFRRNTDDVPAAAFLGGAKTGTDIELEPPAPKVMTNTTARFKLLAELKRDSLTAAEIDWIEKRWSDQVSTSEIAAAAEAFTKPDFGVIELKQRIPHAPTDRT